MNQETTGRIIPNESQVKRELTCYKMLLQHALVRRNEIRARVVPQEMRYMRGQFLNRLGNEIDDFCQHIELLEGMLRDMEE